MAHQQNGNDSAGGGRDRKDRGATPSPSRRGRQQSPSDAADAPIVILGTAAVPTAAATGFTTTSRAFQEAFTIGRSRRCDLLIPTSEETRTVSKVHCRIFPMGDTRRWHLQDLNTLNGTALNGMDLLPGGTLELHDRDEIVLCSTMRTGIRMTVRISDHERPSRVVVQVTGTSSGRPSGSVWEELAPLSPALQALPAPPPLGNYGGPSVPVLLSPTAVVHGTPVVPVTPVQGPRRSSPMSAIRTAATARNKRERNAESNQQRGTRATMASNVGTLLTDEDNQQEHGEPRPLDDGKSPSNERKRSRRTLARDDKERFMVCPVCLDFFHHSATLACSHTFCGHCLGHWFRTSPTVLSCPECRAVVRHVPVRNRALDDLVRQLVGDTVAYEAAQHRRRSTTTTTRARDVDLQDHPKIFTRWSPDTTIRFRSFLGDHFGEERVAACRAIGLTDAAVDHASAAELLLAAQNLGLDCTSLRAIHEAIERLKILIQFG